MKFAIKKLSFIMIMVLIFLGAASCSKKKDPETNKPVHTLNAALTAEKKAAFDFFWEEQESSDTALKSYGLIPDRYPNNGLSSIASVGFGLAGFTIGVESEYITKAEAEERAYQTLLSMKELERVHGFYYHFYNYYTGFPSSGSEVSVIDTGIFICGALTVGGYFGGRVQELADEIYQSVEWNWYVNPNNHLFYMGYNASTNKFSGAWDVYGEQLMLYFLGAGSKNYATGKTEYMAFNRLVGSYGGYSFIHSWFGSLFTHQYSHAFIDFRNKQDENGTDWFQNSIDATLSSQKYAMSLSESYVTLNDKAFGLTACDGPYGYGGSYGSNPSGYSNDAAKTDGTIAPAGSLGSLVFAPTQVKASATYFSNLKEGVLIGDYGFIDAYNLDVNWFDNDIIGIDKGITLLMIGNYETEVVWKSFNKQSFMSSAWTKLGFTGVTGDYE